LPRVAGTAETTIVFKTKFISKVGYKVHLDSNFSSELIKKNLKYLFKQIHRTFFRKKFS